MIGIYNGFPALYDEFGRVVVIYWPTARCSSAAAWSKAIRDAVAIAKDRSVTAEMQIRAEQSAN